jgi:hypothetical protein
MLWREPPRYRMAVSKYLDRYAEPESQLLEGFDSRFDYCLVIPTYDEPPDFLDNLEKLAQANDHVLFILVINQPDNIQSCPANNLLFSTIDSRWKLERQQDLLSSCTLPNDCQMLVVDRFDKGEPIPAKQGVGLARKIGADIACRLIHNKLVRSPWIFSTDADAVLPREYFRATERIPVKGVAALTYPFSHKTASPQSPTALYELSLNYYVAGLEWAGSPYAYHTIGSVIATHYRHYAQVRGYPPRAGGEDFYLLNKLRKTGEILRLKEPRIILLGRESMRVPFGTGPAVKKISELENPLEEYLYYHPDCFSYLRCWLKQARLLWETRNDALDLESLLHSTAEQVMRAESLSGLSTDRLVSALEQVGVGKMLGHAKEHGNNRETWQRHMDNSFDAFKTLKFIHALRDSGLNSLPLAKAASGEYRLTIQPGQS